MTSTRDQVYFAFVEVVPERADSVLGPGAGGAYTHVAATADGVDAFLEVVTRAAHELGLQLASAEWVATAHDLTAKQAQSDYYHDLMKQLRERAVGWAELKTYPDNDETESAEPSKRPHG